MDLNKILSKKDSIFLLELIYSSLLCQEKKDIIELINRLKNLIPFEFAFSLLVKIANNGMLKEDNYHILNINYPSEWLDLYMKNKFYNVDPIFKENFTKFKLQYWADTYKRNRPPKEFICAAESFDIKQGYTYGLTDRMRSEASLFSISERSLKPNIRNEMILKYIIPHFHQALNRNFKKPNKKDIVLSSRQKEVLNWIKEGKSTWDISVILGISERTVKFHADTIMQKLNVVNRAQAVAVAFEQGLIDI